jgi:SAM-dependent methyltransferase
MPQTVEAFRKIGRCRLCESTNLSPFLDFGNVPLGNNLQENAAEARSAQSYPLTLERCGECGHFQLGHAVNPETLYATNYTYLSGVGGSFVRHFHEYAGWAGAWLTPGALVVDVGSNDGTCLKAFRDRGCRVCGVDPASMPAGLANEAGIETLNDFFGPGAVAQIRDKHGPADYVTSHNVLAHVDDLRSTFAAISDLLREGGYFCFEVGYFRDVLRGGCFDTIYHEHLDYHHAAPLVRLLTQMGFSAIDLSVNAVQGGSLRLLLQKDGKGEISENAQAFLDAEAQSVVNDPEFLENWRNKIESDMATFRSAVRERIERGAVVVGYGAPTKATLLMKVAELTGEDIAFVVEDNPYKAGKYLPGTGIPIVPTAQIASSPPDVIILFAWNFAEDIIEKIRGRFEKPVVAITPLPVLRTVDL